MAIRAALTDLAMRLMNAGHRAILVISRGRVGWTVGRLLVVELHTTGRSSGKPRSTMLTSPVYGDGRYVLVASKGGDDRDPDWYSNLSETPDIELTIRGERHRLRARTASAEEKAELWPEIVAAYPGYERYQRKTRRDIPVIICEPADAPPRH